MPSGRKHRRKNNKWPTRLKKVGIAISILLPLTAAGYFFVLYEPALSDQEYYDNAQKSYQAGDSRVAVIELKNAIKANPNNKDARFLLGKIYIELEQGAAAEKELERSGGFKTDPQELRQLLAKAQLLQGKAKEAIETLTSGPGSSGSYSYDENILIAQSYFAMGERANARDSYNEALTKRPGSIEATVGLARIAYVNRDVAIAKTYIEQLQDRADKDWQAWALKGDIARAERQLPVAKAAYRRAFELKENAIEPRLFHAMIALEEKSFDEAEEDAKKLLAINPKHPAGHYIQGQLYLANKQLKEAQSSFEEAIRHVDYVPVFRQLGITHFRQGNLVQAEEYLKKYIKMVPGDVDAQKVLSAIYVKQNKLDDAKTTLKSVASASTLNAPLQRMMAGLEEATGEPEKATEILSALLSENPESIETHLQLGQTLLKQRKPEQALKVFTQAEEKDPTSTSVKLLLIRTNLLLKNHDAALSKAQQLKSLEPDNPKFASVVGTVYMTLGNSKKAEEEFEKAQQRYPGDFTSGHQLGLMAIRNKQYEKAKGYYEAVLAHDQTHLQSQIQIGLIEHALERPTQAQKVLKQAAHSHPENPRPKLVIARYFLATNQPQKALNWLQQIEGATTQSPNYLKTLGQTYLMSQQPDKATDAFTKLNAIRPSAANHWLEAKARYQQNDLAGSRNALLQAKKIVPDSPQIESALLEILVAETEAAIRQKNISAVEKGLAEIKSYNKPMLHLVLLASFEESRGNYDKAIGHYRTILAEKPHSKIMTSLQRALTLSGQTELAIQEAEEWLQRHPEDHQVAFHLANSMLSTNRTDETITHYEELLPKQPENVIILNNLAYLYIDRDLEKAAQYAEQAYQLAPKFAAVVDTYGWIALKQGQHRKALNALSKAHTLDPNEPSIQYHMASALAQNDKKLDAIKMLRELSDQEFEEKPEALALLSSLEWKPE